MFREIRTLGTARAPYFSSECRLVGISVNRFLRHGMQRRSRELLHLGAACPEIQRKASGCNCEGSAEFGGIPQRPTGIAHHVVRWPARKDCGCRGEAPPSTSFPI